MSKLKKYKLKTHKGAQARFRITPTGKILRAKGLKSHLRRKKSAHVRRLFDKMLPVSSADKKRIAQVLPYGTP